MRTADKCTPIAKRNPMLRNFIGAPAEQPADYCFSSLRAALKGTLYA
jgi:hypothetical protein